VYTLLSDLLDFLLQESWGQVLTILSVLGLVIGAIRFIILPFRRKLEIEIQEKEWRNYTTPQTNDKAGLDIRLSTRLLFHNKLGKDTTLNEIRLEREDHDPIILTNATSILTNRSYLMHHIWELSHETSIKGKLVVKHTHGESSFPLDEKIPVPIDDLPYHGIRGRRGIVR
jgi:hypothetical protein